MSKTLEDIVQTWVAVTRLCRTYLDDGRTLAELSCQRAQVKPRHKTWYVVTQLDDGKS